MKEIATLLENDSQVLLIAPTGWGKTTLLLDLISGSTRPWIYLAPLRALANEFYIRSSKIKKSYLIKSHKEIKELTNAGLDFKLLVITPELLFDETLLQISHKSIFVFDEIHLFTYWGESFRPRLRECFEDVLSLGFPSLSLSATMEDSLLDKWKDDTSLNCENNFIINIGNHSLKKDPNQILYYPSRFSLDILKELVDRKTENTKLIFCGYRDEVSYLKEKLQKQGKFVVSCVGGETENFSLELAKCPKPEFIISTSALSHGVNLPKISVVLLNYKIPNYDFWIQMIGRAGRRDEEFQVYTQNYNYLSRKQIIVSMIYLLFIKLKNKLYINELRRYFNS